MPRRVPAFTQRPVAAVACGQHHSLAVTDWGDVYAWGRGSGLIDIDIEIDLYSSFLLLNKSLSRFLLTHASFDSRVCLHPSLPRHGYAFDTWAHLRGAAREWEA